jgi:hypothetical protein
MIIIIADAGVSVPLKPDPMIPSQFHPPLTFPYIRLDIIHASPKTTIL